MNESVTRKITEMKRSEWVAFNWINVTEHGQPEPVYLRGTFRPIEDAISAAKEFDVWIKGAHTEYKKKINHTQPDTGQSGHKI